MRTEVILAAGGRGTRLKAAAPKPLVLLQGKPLLVYPLEIFEKSPHIDGVIVVAPENQLQAVETTIRDFSLSKVRRVVPGGARRRDSVARGLEALEPQTEAVVIHDAARPLISAALLESAIEAVRQEAAVITAVPVKPTIKRVNPQTLTVEKTLDRRWLWEIQTPQVFRKELILRAHRESPDHDVTDDAGLVEMLGEAVYVIRGEYRNLKITTQEDMIIAGSLLAANGLPWPAKGQK